MKAVSGNKKPINTAFQAKIKEHNDRIKNIYSGITIPKNINNNNDNVLPTPSDEQNEIIMQFQQGYNLKIEAVAGAGKTTTLLQLATISKCIFGVKSLILTYNKTLQLDIEKQIINYGLKDHCQVYTYHGYASRIYRNVINNDKLLRQYLQEEPKLHINNDVLLLDEVQDMNEDYYKLVSKIIRHGQLLVLTGDRNQCINQYIDADIKYLVNYSEYFNTGRMWKELTLKTSYRMTPAVANYVNKNILGQDLIIGGNIKYNDVKPLYYYSEWNFSKDNILANMVDIYGPDEIVIMKASVSNISLKKNNTSSLCPLGRLVNDAPKHIRFCVRDENALTEKEMKGKVLLSSFNSMKGKEKACVILYNWDESYFKYYDKSWSADNKNLPNILYVAATRAKSCLILVQDEKNLPFRTTNKEMIQNTCNVIGYLNDKKEREDNKKNKLNHLVTDVIKHRTTTDIINLLSYITVNVITPAGILLPYNNLVGFGTYYEDMRTYYGILIPVIAEYKLKGDIRYNELLPIPDESNGMIEPVYVVKKYNELVSNKNKTLKEWMELIVYNCCLQNGYYFIISQITNYDWVDENYVNLSVERLLSVIDNKGNFEVSTTYKKQGYYNLNGIIDFLDKDIWEFKNTTSLNDEYKIQCAAYISIYFLSKNIMLSGRLFNTRTGELLEISVTNPKEFIDILMKNKS